MNEGWDRLLRRCGTRRLPAGPSAAWRRDSAEQFNNGAPAPKPLPFWGSLTRLGTRRGRSRASGASVPSKAEARCARPLRGGEFLRGGVPPFRGGVLLICLFPTRADGTALRVAALRAGALRGCAVQEQSLAQMCANLHSRKGKAAAAALLLASTLHAASIIDSALALCTPNAAQTGGQRAWRDHPVHPGA